MRTIVLLLLFLASVAPARAQDAAPQATLQPRVYVPVVRSVCLRNAHEEQFIELVRTAPEQGRTEMICDQILQRIALEHALDMQQRCYLAHRNPEGLEPIDRAVRAGYLPDTRGYLNISEIINRSTDGSAAFAAFHRSPPHREIMLAQGTNAEALRAATRYGIAVIDHLPFEQRSGSGSQACGYGNSVVVFAAPSGGYSPYRRTAGNE